MPQPAPIRIPTECTGVDLVHPVDRMPPGKFPFLQNVRAVQERSLTPRAGYGAPVNPNVMADLNVHSIRRMNNSIPGANPAFRRFIGAGPSLYSADRGLIDTGYSGDPLSLVVWRPDQSVEPWMYVGDSHRMQKCRMNNIVQSHFSIGIAPPRTAPGVILDQPHYRSIDDFISVGGYTQAGTAGAPASVSRSAASTVIGVLSYDNGLNVGWVDISPFNGTDDYGWIGIGSLITVNQGGFHAEEMVVQEVHLKVASAKILGIVYDGGVVPGFATVQATTPLAGLDKHSMMGFNVGGVNVEIVPVISYTIGPDGLYSFRVFLGNIHVIGENLQGSPSFRCYATLTHAVNDTLTATAMKSTVTAGTGTLTRAAVLDLSQCQLIVGGGGTSGRPLTPDDYMHISIKVNAPQSVVQGLIEFDIDSTTNDFTQNYYQVNFQPNLAQALLTGGATALATLSTAAQSTLISEVVAPAGGPGFAGASSGPNTVPAFLQLYGGNNAWTEILIPLAKLQRIGADTTRGIQDVKKIRVSLQTTGSVDFYVSSWWVGGGFGPDTGLPEAQPLFWRYRYRSTLTGAKSQQGPAIRTGIPAYRQQVMVTPAQSPDPQVDQIDIERFGGVLNEWHYVGTMANSGATAFADTYSDDELKNSPSLETDAVLPWPSFDTPKTGTVNVVGTRVFQASGDAFDTSWAPGQEILIAGVPYTVYGQPESTTVLTTVQNVGVLNNVPFLVAEPVLTGQPFQHILGPFDNGFLLAFGDPRNPGTVRCSKGNDPDSAPISYYLELTSPSEPIIGGVIWDNNAIVATDKRFFRVSIDLNAIASGQGNVLVRTELQVGRGLFAPWAICAGPLIWFLDEAGVPCATDGSRAESIVETDLRPLFPHDGVPGVAVNNLSPPDLTATTKLRLCYTNGMLRFFYKNIEGAQRELIYNPVRKGWWPNFYTVDQNLAYWEEGESIVSLLFGGQDGNIYQEGGFGDNTAPIACEIQWGYNDSGSPRTEKFYSDAMLDADTQGVSLSLVQQFDLGLGSLPPQTVTGILRTQFPLDVNSGAGKLGRNIRAIVTWFSATAAPVIYEWQPWGYDTGTFFRTSWIGRATSHGISGWQHIRDGYIAFQPLLQVSVFSLIVTIDGVAQPPVLFFPSGGGMPLGSPGALSKVRVDFTANKGKLYQYQILPLISGPNAQFLLFEKDIEIAVKQWGSSGPYQTVRPFGDGGP